jgi:hypothetical protein
MIDNITFSDELIEWATGKEIFVNDKLTPFKFPECPQCQTTLKKIVGKKLILSKPPYFRFRCSKCDFDNFVQMKFKEIQENPFFI